MLTRHATAASLLVIILFSVSAAYPAKAQGGAALAYCKADVKRICAGIAPGGGRLIRCLKQHQNDVSIGCAKELKAVKTKMGK